MEKINLVSITSQLGFALLNLDLTSKVVMLSFLSAFAGVNLLFRLHYVRFAYKYTPSYSINDLLTFDQISAGFTSFVLFLYVFIPIMLSTPINEVFGGNTIPCEFGRLVVRAHVAFKACNGLGLAAYRLINIKIGEQRKANKIVLTSTIFSTMISLCHYLGTLFSNNKMSEEFCTGHSDEMNQIIFQNSFVPQNNWLQIAGRVCQMVALLFTFGVTASQVCIYVWIAWFRYQQDKSVVGMVNGSSLKKRKKSTMVSFGGQVLTFSLDISALAFVQIFMVSASFPLRTYFVIVIITESAILAVCQWMTSPQILRHILHISI